MMEPESSSQEIQSIAQEMWERMNWYRELGVDGWKKSALSPSSPIARPDIQQEMENMPKDKTTSASVITLEEVRSEIGDCQRCKLCSGRKNIVFGEGNPRATLMFVGEAPGADEDQQARPFVGRAGQLLTKMIIAMGFSREEIFIANIIKCRPPENRNPQPDEIAACQPFLLKQIEAIRPKIICALGTFSAQTLLSSQQRISDLRGKFHDFHGVKVLPTFHPAYLLRNPNEKKRVWEDLQKIMEELKKTA
jgi:DNA polymerase